jgi:hypothetical protein
MRQKQGSNVEAPVQKINPTIFALFGGVILLLFLIWFFTGNRNPNQDRLNDSQLTQAKAQTPEKRCSSQATYDLIKRELFRHAAEVRGSDQAAYDRLSAYASLRMENPVMESQDKGSGAVNCAGSLSVDLPPGVAVVGGRRTLSADVDYTVQQATDNSGAVVLLRNADAIVTPLATLARVGEPAQAPAAEAPAANMAMPQQPMPNMPAPMQPAQPAPQAQAPPAAPAAAHPSFDCGKARTSGEVAVCSDSGLAALDRNMAGEYGRAIRSATPAQAALLRQTRDRFLAYRDRCPTHGCMAEAYAGRMREIRDIVEGRWAPPR